MVEVTRKRCAPIHRHARTKLIVIYNPGPSMATTSKWATNPNVSVNTNGNCNILLLFIIQVCIKGCWKGHSQTSFRGASKRMTFSEKTFSGHFYFWKTIATRCSSDKEILVRKKKSVYRKWTADFCFVCRLRAGWLSTYPSYFFI